MLVVTGGAGFIGSNLVKGLNDRGEDDILIVDDLTDGRKFVNLVDCAFSDYLDRADFRERVKVGEDLGPVSAVFHQGACADTVEQDGRYMLEANYETSKELFFWCQARKVPFVYASSAAVYGATGDFRETGHGERPLNVYGWSKLVFDRWLRRRWSTLAAPVVGLRYFNVYGPREAHKGRMASVVHHFSRQVAESGKVRLFAGSHGYPDGEHCRDFVFVDDVVRVNLWAANGACLPGIYNVGTGEARSFNDIARAVIAWHGRGEIEYIPMPGDLKQAYQAFTQAELTALRAAGYDDGFAPIEIGIKRTLDALAQASGAPAARP
jgi:ADP-L-glycero-D-manno-heptose 6-epimerase